MAVPDDPVRPAYTVPSLRLKTTFSFLFSSYWSATESSGVSSPVFAPDGANDVARAPVAAEIRT